MKCNVDFNLNESQRAVLQYFMANKNYSDAYWYLRDIANDLAAHSTEASINLFGGAA